MLDLNERQTDALERIAAALASIAASYRDERDSVHRDYEEKHRPKVIQDATQIRIHDTETELRKSQGDTGEATDEEWLTPSPFDALGPREAQAEADAEVARKKVERRTETSRRRSRTS